MPVSILGQQDSLYIDLIASEPTIDGVIEKDEWQNSKKVQLVIDSKKTIDVLVAYDHNYLYVSFSNIEQEHAGRLNAEILLKTSSKNSSWDEQTFWFHSSYSNCHAIGEYYVWEHCSNDPLGWKANTYPFTDGNDNMEFRISFETLKIDPSLKNLKINIAFKVSGADEVHSYWPNAALIEDPETWGTLLFN
jgi:hypothetical protein